MLYCGSDSSFNVLPYLPDSFHTVFNVSLVRFATCISEPFAACIRIITREARRVRSAREPRAHARRARGPFVFVEVWSGRLGLVYALHCHRCTEYRRALPTTRPMMSSMPPGCRKKVSAVRTNVRTALGCKLRANHAQRTARVYCPDRWENKKSPRTFHQETPAPHIQC